MQSRNVASLRPHAFLARITPLLLKETVQNYFGVMTITKIEFPLSKIDCVYRALNYPITMSKTTQIGSEAGKLNGGIAVWYLTGDSTHFLNYFPFPSYFVAWERS